MLARLRGPVRSLATPDDLLPYNNPINAPREIMRLINWMMSDSSHVVSGVRSIYTCCTDVPFQDGLFTLSANEKIMRTIREVSIYILYFDSLIFIQVVS